MPCDHKFIDYLNLENIDFIPTTLIVGTFNPSWPAGNNASWFYGRIRNNYFWDVLPRLYNPLLNLRQPPATHVDWKIFCSNNHIALTDIIRCIDDADENNEEHGAILAGYDDQAIANNFHFTFTDIVGLLEQNPTIRNVYLTRQPGIDLYDEQWALVEQYRDNIDPGLHVRNLLTPSANARFQIGPFNLANPGIQQPLRNFIFWSWQQQWHF